MLLRWSQFDQKLKRADKQHLTENVEMQKKNQNVAICRFVTHLETPKPIIITPDQTTLIGSIIDIGTVVFNPRYSYNIILTTWRISGVNCTTLRFTHVKLNILPW